MRRYVSALLALSLLCACAAPAPAEKTSPPEAAASPAESLLSPEAPSAGGEAPEISPAGAEEAAAPAPVQASEAVPEGTAVPAEAPASAADAIAQAILNSQPDPEGYAAQTGEDLELYLTGLYGLEDYAGMEAAVYAASGVDSREIAVIRLASMTSEGASVMEALEEYRQNRLGDFYGYSPGQAALVEGGEVTAGWSCVALLICEDMDKARAAFETAAGQASAYAPAAPEPAPASTEAPAPTESPALAGAAAPAGLPIEETRWFIPFDPPNEFDMTPYDLSAVLTAWETGEDSGLGDKDAVILDKAKAALEACGVSEEMSGIEKELALHDWLTANCDYDQTVYAPRTPMGREDNMDPYGALAGGYGICLGYATTFQLLMSMAGVECITVVGAANDSRQDHAWNMVKLAEEWYCVDVTWDDPEGAAPDDQRCHSYFNVTSEYMRSTNHQWDYQNVPEAAATRFFWDGTGPLPQ